MFDRLRNKKWFAADMALLVLIGMFVGWVAHVGVSGPRENASERCLYAASSFHNGSWKLLPECNSLEPWRLLDVQQRLGNMGN